jgi:hypothetical protein
MSPWVYLHQQHSELRAGHERTVDRLKGPLRRLAGLKAYCDRSLPWFLKTTKADGRVIVFTQPHGGSAGPIELQNLPDLTNARLSIQATIQSTSGRMNEFSAAISGKTAAGVDWTVAIHLENELRRPAEEGWSGDWRGDGACSHAIFHCHVGPDLDAKPKVRVPLPAVGPEHALDWLLATVVPGFEPMPWADVNKLLAKASQ